MCGSTLSSCLQTPENSVSSRAAPNAPTKRKRVSFVTKGNCPSCGFPCEEIHNDCANCRYLVDYNGYVGFVISDDEFESQSAPVEPVPITTEETKDDSEQNVVFHDDLPQTVLSYGVKVSDDVYNHAFQSRGDLTNFLSRPVLIETYDWIPNTTFVTTKINIWETFLKTPAIENKIKNFKLLRGTLKIKILLNGSPYHYGRLVVGMYPSRYTNNLGPTADPLTSLPCLNYYQGGVPFAQRPTATLCTQRPKVFLNPAKNLPVEIHWPFFRPTSWLEVNNETDYLRMGYLEIWELNELQVVNLSGVTAPLTVQFFAWMEDVELSGVTDAYFAESSKPVKKKKKNKPSQFKTQNVDEFQGDGVVSAPASAVAGIAARLTDIPVIGKFAKATQIGATSIAQIASLFGFSNPNLVDKQCVITQMQMGRTAHTSGNDVCIKLSLDPKNELTIDPSTVGLNNEDEMSFMYVAKREALIAQFDWPTSKVSRRVGNPGLLFRSKVNPMVAPITIDGVTPNIKTWQCFTPVGFVALPFDYWTGSLVFRVQVVCSQFHRGRLGIIYVPDMISETATITPNFPETYTHIMDISQECDCSFQVNWAQPWDWNKVSPQTSPSTGISPDIILGDVGDFSHFERFSSNGVFKIVVINDLTLPGNETDQFVSINVYLSAGDDFRVAAPNSVIGKYLSTDTGYQPFPTESMHFIAQGSMSESAYGKQFQEDDPNHQDEYIINGDRVEESPHMMEVYMGEDVRSIRTMLKRYCDYFIASFLSQPTRNYQVVTLSDLPTIPAPAAAFGTNSSLGSAVKCDTGYLDQSSIPMTYFRYYCRGYIGYRGGIKYKAVFAAPSASTNLFTKVNRYAEYKGLEITYDAYNMDSAVTNIVRNRNAFSVNRQGMTSGGIINSTTAGGGFSWEVPFYCRARYIDINLEAQTLPVLEESVYNNIYGYHQLITYASDVSTDAQLTQAFLYTACGEDATFFFFVGVPPMRLYETSSI